MAVEVDQLREEKREKKKMIDEIIKLKGLMLPSQRAWQRHTIKYIAPNETLEATYETDVSLDV